MGFVIGRDCGGQTFITVAAHTISVRTRSVQDQITLVEGARQSRYSWRPPEKEDSALSSHDTDTNSNTTNTNSRSSSRPISYDDLRLDGRKS